MRSSNGIVRYNKGKRCLLRGVDAVLAHESLDAVGGGHLVRVRARG